MNYFTVLDNDAGVTRHSPCDKSVEQYSGFEGINCAGQSLGEILDLLDRISADKELQDKFSNITFRGLMAMASFVDDETQIRCEFSKLLALNEEIKKRSYPFLDNFSELSFGMAGDYPIAAEMGSTMVRVGTSIFGSR